MKILLDTNICIYLIKNKPEGMRRYFAQYSPSEIGISTITVAELQYGVAKSQATERNATALAAFLIPLEILAFDGAAAIAYGVIRAALERKGTVIGALDMLIAAQAVSLDVTLITNNMREFERVPDLRCENWL